jgi:hypothetical protein
MTEQQTAPGPDEIAVAAPQGRPLCHSLTCRNQGRLAEVIVTFGQLGTSWRDALWLDSWGRSYPMCGECWDNTRQVALARRPALVICDHRQSAPPAPGKRGRRESRAGSQPLIGR